MLRRLRTPDLELQLLALLAADPGGLKSPALGSRLRSHVRRPTLSRALTRLHARGRVVAVGEARAMWMSSRHLPTRRRFRTTPTSSMRGWVRARRLMSSMGTTSGRQILIPIFNGGGVSIVNSNRVIAQITLEERPAHGRKWVGRASRDSSPSVSCQPCGFDPARFDRACAGTRQARGSGTRDHAWSWEPRLRFRYDGSFHQGRSPHMGGSFVSHAPGWGQGPPGRFRTA